MVSFTLRISDDVATQIDSYCDKRGLTRSGLIKILIGDFLDERGILTSRHESKNINLNDLIGVLRLDDSHLSESVDDYVYK